MIPGQAVWSVGFEGDIYYWDARIGGAPKIITDIDAKFYDDKSPKINELGQIIWEKEEYGIDGWRDIYYCDTRLGTTGKNIVQLESYLNGNSQINDQGQVVWTGYDGVDSLLYYWDAKVGGEPKILATKTDTVFSYIPQINNQGQVVWEDSEMATSEIYYWDAKVGVTEKDY